MTDKTNDEKLEDPAWLLTKSLGIGLAEARARLAAEAEQPHGQNEQLSPTTTEDE